MCTLQSIPCRMRKGMISGRPCSLMGWGACVRVVCVRYAGQGQALLLQLRVRWQALVTEALPMARHPRILPCRQPCVPNPTLHQPSSAVTLRLPHRSALPPFRLCSAAPPPPAPRGPCSDPGPRLVSHMRFVLWTMSRADDERGRGHRGDGDHHGSRSGTARHAFDRMYADRSSAFWQQLGPPLVDNYYTRSLLGEQVRARKGGGVAEGLCGALSLRGVNIAGLEGRCCGRVGARAGGGRGRAAAGPAAAGAGG